jgi:homogentisate 1,2-dioxygenase
LKELFLNVNNYTNLDQNSPIKIKNGVFAEQLNGTAFTVKRAENQKVWMYKVRPSATQGQFKESSYPFKIIESYLSK